MSDKLKGFFTRNAKETIAPAISYPLERRMDSALHNNNFAWIDEEFPAQRAVVEAMLAREAQPVKAKAGGVPDTVVRFVEPSGTAMGGVRCLSGGGRQWLDAVMQPIPERVDDTES